MHGENHLEARSPEGDRHVDKLTQHIFSQFEHSTTIYSTNITRNVSIVVICSTCFIKTTIFIMWRLSLVLIKDVKQHNCSD